jgi:hypothetical protein
MTTASPRDATHRLQAWCHGGRIGPQTAALLFVLLALVGPADAQVLYGSIVGTVTDASLAAVSGATVIAIHESTNLAREATTRRDGSYGFVNVMPGPHTIRVVLGGFKEWVEQNVPVSVSTVARVDVILEVGSLSEALTVQSERRLLQTDTGDLHTELHSEEITNLPLGSYRNYQALLNLVPGTSTPPPSGMTTSANIDAPSAPLTININGTAHNNNNTRLDGTSDIFIWRPGWTAYTAPAETVDTVSISTSSFDAEQGMAGGAAITVLTKSGSNELHGSAFVLHENEDLRARNFFNPGDKIDTSLYMGGVTLGGPIVKDRLFFFGSWEGVYETKSWTRTGTVATEAMRRGDFSGLGTTIYDPATGNPDGTGRVPFPGNVIPPERISAIPARIQAAVPLPNRDGVFGNYTATGPEEMDRNSFDVKLNYSLSGAAQIWAKYSQMSATVNAPYFLGEAGGGGFGLSVGNGETRVRLATLGTTWTLSPNLVLDGTIGMTRWDQEVVPPDYGTNIGTDVLGIPGTNGDGGAGGDIRTSGSPWFAVSGYTALGGSETWTPIFRNDRSYNLTTNITYVTGRHEVRFGADVVRMELNHWQPENGFGPRGGFFINGGSTALAPSGSPDPFNAYAQFLLGLTLATGKSLQYELMTGREWQFGLYVRDRWQVTRDLTLNVGLRWEKYPLMTRADRGIEYYDDTTNEVLLGGRGGNPEDLGIEVRHPQLLPRIGFAWRLDENDVLRGGYGMTISPMPFSRPLRGWYPLEINQVFVAPNPYLPFGTLEEGIPLFDGPDLSTGVVDLPTTASMTSPYGDHVNRGSIQSWNLTYERRLPADMSLATSYVGTMTTHQLAFYNINAAGAGDGVPGMPLFQRFGRTAWTNRLDGWLSSNYHSLQVALNKPFGRGFFIKGAYTWSKAMNRTDEDGWSEVMWNHPSVLSKNYGPAGYDRTHVFQLAFVAELPFGRGGSGVLDAIVRDWTLNGIVSAFTGPPFTVFASDASVNAPGNVQTADLVGTPTKLGGIGADDPYYDPSAWAPVTEVRFGNTGRNSMRGPGWWNIDLGLFRRFPIGEKLHLEARIEAFNLTNTPHFHNPNDNVNSPGFMTITTAQADERQIRLGLRVSF